jgi:hypothetical protein
LTAKPNEPVTVLPLGAQPPELPLLLLPELPPLLVPELLPELLPLLAPELLPLPAPELLPELLPLLAPELLPLPALPLLALPLPALPLLLPLPPPGSEDPEPLQCIIVKAPTSEREKTSVRMSGAR